MPSGVFQESGTVEPEGMWGGGGARFRQVHRIKDTW